MKPKNGCTGSPMPYKFRPFYLFLFLFQTAVLPGNKLFAQGKTSHYNNQPDWTDSKPPDGALKVGDSIPESFSHLPLKVFLPSQDHKILTLNENKGKLIVLDFWATWCQSCLASIPHSWQLQKDFGDKLQILYVTYQSEKELQQFYKRNSYFRDYPLPVIFGDTALKKMFPHRLIPHMVWISPDGTLIQQTSSYDLTAENIKKIIDRKPVDFKTARKVAQDFDFRKPLDSRDTRSSFYSAISPYKEGLPSSSGYLRTDTSVRFFSTNTRLISLFQKALGLISSDWPASRILYEHVDKDYFELNSPADNRLKTYCVELNVPRRLEAEIFPLLKRNLNIFFGMDAFVEKRKVAAYCLVVTNPGLLPQSDIADRENNLRFNDNQPKFLKGEKLFVLTDFLNTLANMPPVLDQSGIDYRVDLDLPHDLSDISALNNTLKHYGLALKKDVADLDMLVIKPYAQSKYLTENK